MNHESKLIIIIGNSGSGKSTTEKLIANNYISIDENFS